MTKDKRRTCQKESSPVHRSPSKSGVKRKQRSAASTAHKKHPATTKPKVETSQKESSPHKGSPRTSGAKRKRRSTALTADKRTPDKVKVPPAEKDCKHLAKTSSKYGLGLRAHLLTDGG
ncbi:uncharacterized protein LOC119378072, partial [Rhipicephalus sanguineus]|uniref:uncharacterized protein LOC119378072 n=1 Tax=Rhipicephalus sanguineus TaxID=34632 RepID=UPI0020C3E94E